MACIHLDCYAGPRSRVTQIKPVIETLKNKKNVLLAGDWNTNTLNTTNSVTLAMSLLKQIFRGPKKVATEHYPYPEKHFDRLIFDYLSKNNLEHASFNEEGIGTYDLMLNDMSLAAMARDRLPAWLLKTINRTIDKCGGQISLKIDWFAGRGLKASHSQVVKLEKGRDYPKDPPSDHYPIVLEFEITQ